MPPADHPTEQLTEPADDEEIYLARGEEVLASRPFMQGDIFSAVSVPGYDDPIDIALLGHPCSMRGAGGKLKPRLPAALVKSYAYLPPNKWSEGHYNVFPLPALHGADGHAAVSFEEIFSISSEQLDPDKRIAVLSSRGVYIFQQRHVNSLTRVTVPLVALQEGCEHVLEEANLMEEWVDDLADQNPESIAAEVEAFTTFMDSGHRDDLLDPTRRPQVRRSVAKAIAVRAGAN